jgi:hypothetical protein
VLRIYDETSRIPFPLVLRPPRKSLKTRPTYYVPPFSVTLNKRGIDFSVHRLGEGKIFEDKNRDPDQRHIGLTKKEASVVIHQLAKKGRRRTDIAKLFAGRTRMQERVTGMLC